MIIIVSSWQWAAVRRSTSRYKHQYNSTPPQSCLLPVVTACPPNGVLKGTVLLIVSSYTNERMNI